jgi:hypothetical protein
MVSWADLFQSQSRSDRLRRTFVGSPAWTLQDSDQVEKVIVTLRLQAQHGGGGFAAVRVELLDESFCGHCELKYWLQSKVEALIANFTIWKCKAYVSKSQTRGARSELELQAR